MITIYKIATLANCSPSTVSKALNNSPEISESKKREILSIAKSNNYIINQNARSLSTKNSKLLGIIYVEDSGLGLAHHFYSRIIENFRKCAEQHEYDIIFIHNHNNYGDSKMSYYEHCKYRQVSGVFVPTFDGHYDDQIDNLIQSEIPLITADSSNRKVSTVVADDVHGAELATKYLLQLGHKRIVHIAGPTAGEHASLSAINRACGFNNIVSAIKGQISMQIYNTNDYTYQSGYEAMQQIFKSQKAPTAIFAASDILALGAIHTILEHGLTVPEDISIIGYDDIEMLQYFKPSLSTIRQPKELLGKKSAELLIASIENNIDLAPIELLPVELIERASCKAIA